MLLITGGAGYIGSHCVLDLIKNGYECVILDNLSEGNKKAIQSKYFEQADLSNIDEIRTVFTKYQIDAVIHFAGSCYVGVSVNEPQEYYYNNVVNTLNLLKVMMEFNVKKIVFSSSCATYGAPEYSPIDEKHPQSPINPYGQTKLMIEKILHDYDKAYGLKYMALRYFNAAGAENSANIGESHSPETHLIPLVLQNILGKRDNIKIFGTDYETPDGTCIRDYIHVNDLATAHRFAVKKLLSGSHSNKINLGTGKGTSIKEIIGICEKVTGKKANVILDTRREGDPPILLASNEKAIRELDWKPAITDIEYIIKTAWNWEQKKQY